MKKFKELSLLPQAILVYILSLVVSVLFYYPFDKLYVWIFKPIMVGQSIFLPIPDLTASLINGTIFAFYLFLSFFTFWLIKSKQWLIWIVGAILPILIALSGGGKDIFWATILSALGWLLAQSVNLIRKKLKNNS